MNNDKNVQSLQEKYEQLLDHAELTEPAIKLFEEILGELEHTVGQNERLKKVILKQSGSSNRMNSKLRDALME
ncbi:hypothetical protein BK126_13150 [Paenibacillus sp. FSL H7-0326]|uniref:hypothetical protein n=1 Tax=Paenibacillus sp. FSL H7-0326 TaxID=1921144 RepID=UPI00096FF3D7|nr:hypothetical protein [Paenibacillus sp. FSL H7-0326]OMC68752.1 hypothetical protein BK126_13150 [Paenibacillus sp. FSL H7-0326]